jgi:RimJ/RimL family protein N-acetyltransferase
LDERFWNKGYATEATKFWLEYGFNEMKIQEMNAYTHTQNGASNHILSKCGMQFIEEYTAEDGINWKWWQLLNPNQK